MTLADSETHDRDDILENDRMLLKRLQLNYSEAATFLSRSRQAVQSKLSGPEPAPNNYFTPGEIVILVSAARQLGREIPPKAVSEIRDYVAGTRGKEGEVFKLFVQLLNADTDSVDVSDATAIVFLLPGFAELRTSRPDVAEALADLVEGLPDDETRPAVFVLSSTEMQAQMAGRWLGVELANCFGSDLTDHYLPTILVYRRAARPDQDAALPFVLTERGTFEAAPRFRTNMIADCVQSMMPPDVAKALRPEGPASRVNKRQTGQMRG